MPVSTDGDKGDVKNIKTPKIGFLTLAAWLVCFHPQFVKAGGEPLPVELSAVENEPSESELGLGKFSPFPFHLSATLRRGFVDNLHTASSQTLPSPLFANADVGMVEDRTENTFGHEFRFLLWPTTTIVADYRFQLVSFTHRLGDDSTTHFFLGGFDHNFSPRFNISVRGGEEFRSFQGD